MNIDVMSASYIQAERIIRVESDLGPDVLLPERLTMREKVSGLFELTVAVSSKRTDVKAEELAGKLADVSVETGDGGRRTWNGLVTDLIEGPIVTRGLRAYTLVLRPQHWLLSQRSDCRIWMDKTSVEIAQMLMGEHGLASPVTKGIVMAPPPQHYSVQFNETDLDYLTRRLEEDGIFYWFEHEGGSPGSVSATHTLHLASDVSGYRRGPDTDVRFAMGSSDRNHVTKFEKRFRYLPGKRSGRDWNFETPGQTPGGGTPSLIKLPKNEAYELYEYPSLAGYGSGTQASEGIDNDAVERQSKLRMMSSEADHQRSEGASTVRTLAPGRRFKPYDVANPMNIFDEQVIVEITHQARDRSYATNEQGDPEYQNIFIAIPSKTPATPHRTTRRPKIEGTQVALVAGPEGEEIHPDEYGRIKVWFPWDRRAKRDGSDTCWIRVGQNWAGAGWGGQIIPRIGMEVMVMYLDGDPDRPVVTGVVPNAKQKVPYTLPANKTKTVMRSDSHKSTGFNEMSFEDQTGKENMFFHAQKDQTVKVQNNQSSRVDANALHSVGANQSLEVGANMSKQIGGGLNMVVGGVGGIVNAIAGGLLAALGGKSAAMLQQAMAVAGAAAADSPSDGDRNAAAASAATGGAGGGGAVGDAMQAVAGAHAGLMAAGALGTMIPGMDKVRSGLNEAAAGDMRSAGGASMNEAGSGLASQIGSMIGKGIFNTLVSKMQNTSVGIAQTEQVGVAKVLTVGQVYNQSIGNTKRVMIGKELFVGVGGGKDKDGNEIPPKSILIMKDDGTILLKGVKIYVDGDSHVQVTSAMIDHN
jgi:type VI secretion system secreted protein VgrG